MAIAWIGVFDGEPDPEFIWWDEAKARRWISTRPGVELAPLFLAPTLTDEEREAVRTAAGCMGMWMLENGVTEDESMRRSAATLRGLLERTNPRLAALQKLTELDEELGLPRTPPTHSNQSEVSVRPTIDSELVQ